MANALKMARTIARALVLTLGLCAAQPGQAAPPDPVRFGVVIEAGDVRTARRWLDEGLNPDFVGDRIGTGLMIAAWEGNVDMMALFVERGARIDARNELAEEALQLAAWKGRLEAVRWLLDHGAQVNRPDRNWTALHYATFAGHQEVVDLLLARGADVNARSTNGSTVLMMAAREGREALARQLVDAGADPKRANDAGETALVWAMRHRHFRIAQAVSSASEFAQAAKAPPGAFGAPVKSTLAPVELSDLLRQIRVAEAEGEPTEALRARFAAAIDVFRKDAQAMAVRNGKLVRVERPRALLITAQPGGDGGERAELSYAQGGQPKTVPELVKAIELATAQGRPTWSLRRALREAASHLRETAPQAPR